MKKFNVLNVLLFLSFTGVYAQMSYYYRGEKVPLTVDRNYVHIIADEDFMKSPASDHLFQSFNMERSDSKPAAGYMLKLKFKSAPEMAEYSRIVSSLKQDGQIRHVLPFFVREGAEPIGTSDIFCLKLKDIKDTAMMRRMAEEKGVQIVSQIQYMPLWFILSLRNSAFAHSIEATDYFYETRLFADIDPAFMFHFKPNCANDPGFGSQWGLASINICNAWEITRGAGATVAVVDKVIDNFQEDLSPNFHPNSSAHLNKHKYNSAENHGTLVAGIIAAVRGNDRDIAGVAPESFLVKIGHNMDMTNYIATDLAEGISRARIEGEADVINCSWGDDGGDKYHSSNVHGKVLEDAIDDALQLGRNGKGCVLVFASGNNGKTDYVDYPGNYTFDNLVVGGIHSNGAIDSDSNYDMYYNRVDIVGPGVNIISTNNGNGTTSDSGTSFAAPHVSGVAALILSLNPELYGSEVRDIIEKSAQKIRTDLYTYTNISGFPNGTRHAAMGHGLVDAHAALLATPHISGKDTVLYTGTEFTFKNPPSGTIYWTVSNPNIFEVVTLTGTSTTIKRKGKAIDNLATLYARTGSVNGAIVASKKIKTCQAADISGSGTVCYDGSVFKLNQSSGTIYWTLSSSSNFTLNPSSTTGTHQATVKRIGSGTGNVILQARINSSSGTVIAEKNITACTAPSISGNTSVYTGSQCTFNVSNAPSGYTWDCSSHFTPVPKSPGKYTASNAGQGWVCIKLNGTEISSRYNVTITDPPSINIVGPSTICHYGYYELDTGETANWSVSPGFSLNLINPTVPSITVHTSGSSDLTGTLTAVLNGKTVTKTIYATPSSYSCCWTLIDFINMTNLSCSAYVKLIPLDRYGYPDPNLVYRWNVTWQEGVSISSQTGTWYSNYLELSFSPTGGGARIDAYLINGCGESPHTTVEYRIATGGCGSYSPVNVYPNPVSNLLNIEIDNEAVNLVQSMNKAFYDGKLFKTTSTSIPAYDIHLYDWQGNLLGQQKIKDGSAQFNVANLPIGIYYLHVYDGINDNPEIKQIVVEH